MSLYFDTEEQGSNLSDLLIFEIDRAYSRDYINLAADENIPNYTVLQLNTDGTYSAFDAAAEEGETPATASAVLITQSTAFMRGVVLNANALQWKSGVTDAQKQTAIKSLKTLTIIVRD